MGIHRLENSVNPLHLVTPERVVVPMSKGFDSPAGVLPFHRMLEAQNLIARAEGYQGTPIVREADSYEPTNRVSQDPVSQDPISQNPGSQSPKLGEVSPVEVPSPRSTPICKPIEPTKIGGLLDIYF